MSNLYPDTASTTRVSRRTSLLFFGLVGLGLASRIVFVFSTEFQMNSDQAVVYLMAKHVADGEFPAFFWGQSYGGTFLSLLAGTVMLATGPSIAVLSISSVVIWAVAAVILKYVVAHALGGRAGIVAGLLFWFPGAVIFGTSVIDPGFYGPSLLFGLSSLLVALKTHRHRGILGWIALGALAGLCLWTSPMALAFAAPAVAWAIWTDRRWQLWLVGTFAALAAALPWIIETIQSRLSSVKPLGGAAVHPESIASIFTSMFPSAFPGGSLELVQFVIALATVALYVLLAYRAITRRNTGALLMTASTVLLLGVLVVGTGVRLAPDSVRYSGFLIPSLAMSVAWLVTSRRVLSIGTTAIAILVTTATVFLGSSPLAFSEPKPFGDSLPKVDRFLDKAGVDAAYGSYWAAYSLSAESDEQPTIASILPRRYAAYEANAAGDSPMAVVVFAGAENDNLLKQEPGLPSFTRTEVDGYAVFVFDAWFDIYRLPMSLN